MRCAGWLKSATGLQFAATGRQHLIDSRDLTRPGNLSVFMRSGARHVHGRLFRKEKKEP